MDRDSWSKWSVFSGPWTETHVAIFSTMDRDINERFSPWTETVVTVVQHMDRDTIYMLIQSGETLEHLNFTDIVYQLPSLQQKYLKKLRCKPL